MAKLTEAENLAALKAAKKRGARVNGQLDAKSRKLVEEERAKIVAARRKTDKVAELKKRHAEKAAEGEEMRSAGELAQEAAAAGEGDPVGTPTAGGGA